MTPTQAKRLAKIRAAGTLRVMDGLRAADHYLRREGHITWEAVPAPKSRIGYHYHLTATTEGE
jgi:hypothetical protein